MNLKFTGFALPRVTLTVTTWLRRLNGRQTYQIQTDALKLFILVKLIFQLTNTALSIKVISKSRNNDNCE